MIKQIIDTCVESLKELSWLANGDVNGLVRADVQISKDSSGRPIRKVIPIACNNIEDCGNNKAKVISPDDSYPSVIWFEDLGTRTDTTKTHLQLVSAFRIVGWLNSVKFDAAYCDLSDMAVSEVLKKINATTFNIQGIAAVNVKLTSIPEKSYLLFSKWSYDIQKGFTSPPNDYFALDFSVHYVKGECSYSLTLKDGCT